jgi:hypothetical protein
MKKNFFYWLTTTLLMTISTTTFAQKFKIVEGSLDAIKSATKLNLEMDYSEMSVGKFKTEAEYLTKKKSEYNKKEEGKGDKWEKDWIQDRKERFQPEFKTLFNKHCNKFEAGDFPKEKYTMIVKTTRTEPGYNVVVSRKNAEVDGEIIVVETANKNNVLLRIKFTKALGRTFGGYDYDTGFRIQEAYADLGKALGKYMD